MSHKTWRMIEFELTQKSVKQAIREIEECKRQLTEAMNDLIEQLAQQGASIAKMQVASMDAVDTGELEQSIYGYFDPESRIGYVIAGAPHAFYVEYGTGPVGKENPHPDPKSADWEYDIGPTIHENVRHPEWGRGWWYPGDDGRRHWTQGQPARPFMYNTLTWLEEAAEALGRKVFS